MLLEKDLWTSKVRPLAVVKRQATRKKNGKAIMTEEVISGRNQGKSSFGEACRSADSVIGHRGGPDGPEEYSIENSGRRSGRDYCAATVGVISDVHGNSYIGDGRVFFSRRDSVGKVNAADMMCRQVIPLLRYLDNKLGKYAGTTNVGSYVELVRNRIRVKVATSHTIAEKKSQLQGPKTKYDILWRRLAKEIELRRSLKKTCESLRADIEVTRCATVKLRHRLEASWIAFNEESRIVDELNADLEKKYQTHATEVAVKVKALTECEAARTIDQELKERLEAKCNEMRSQRSLAEEQLCEMEAKLLEAEEKNRQLAEQTNDALT